MGGVVFFVQDVYEEYKSKSTSIRGAAGQKFLTRGSGRVIELPLGSGRVGSALMPNFFGSGRAGSGLKNSGNFGSKSSFFSPIFQIFLKLVFKTAFIDLFHADYKTNMSF